ncbi:hypothetical protein TcasGA2_TC002479 [Tribolium castaneum]|uniref:Uncharacterized protein n=1 Tax=Tribolium castaneum TaxID=7070 RepID=D6WHP9_TRICA|nr:hypothetical protein TcasGA2_TC002479 [Tribolium castaneum]
MDSHCIILLHPDGDAGEPTGTGPQRATTGLHFRVGCSTTRSLYSILCRCLPPAAAGSGVRMSRRWGVLFLLGPREDPCMLFATERAFMNGGAVHADAGDYEGVRGHLDGL